MGTYYLTELLSFRNCPRNIICDSLFYHQNRGSNSPERSVPTRTWENNIRKDIRDIEPFFVGPCHHCMARPQVADGGTASDMEGSCE